MFPDSEIARKITLQNDKCKYVINHGLAPYCEQLLIQNVTASPCHSFSFDESLNKKTQLGQMDLYVRFWNASEELAETRYLTSQFLGGAKADDILEKFETGVSKTIHKANDLLQVASDGPNVNLLFLNLYEEKRCLNELPALLDIETCSIHNIHGSSKNAEKASEWDIGKVLQCISKILIDSSARSFSIAMLWS